MAKLGMPSINISFIEAGIEAINRSQRGIVALLLEEPQATITNLQKDHEVTSGETQRRSRPLRTPLPSIRPTISRPN